MQKSFASLLCFAIIVTILPALRSAQDPDSLRAFLQEYYEVSPIPEDNKTRYLEAWVDLNEDGKKEAIIYVFGPYHCGTGGCRALILQAKGSSYNVVVEIGVTRPPIRMLTTKSHGWYNLAVRVQGGGILEPYEAELRFDGRTYPSNPTMPPARPLQENVEGEILISRDDYDAAKLLYP